jgi:hypothetical protein
MGRASAGESSGSKESGDAAEAEKSAVYGPSTSGLKASSSAM